MDSAYKLWRDLDIYPRSGFSALSFGCCQLPGVGFILLEPTMLPWKVNFSFQALPVWATLHHPNNGKYQLAPWKKSYDKPKQYIKKQRHYFANKGPYSQSYGFSSSHVWMWELDHKESWAPKNWWFWTVALEKTLESPLDCKEIQPVHPKGSQPWIFIRRTDAEAEAPLLWPPDAKSRLIWQDPDAGKDWRQEEKTTEDEMVGWPYWLNGHEFEQALGDSEGQGSLECCGPWGHKESDTTEQLNSNNNQTSGLASWLRWWKIACPCRRCEFYSWFGKIPWRRKWQPTPVFLPGKSMDRGAWLATVYEVAKQSDTT